MHVFFHDDTLEVVVLLLQLAQCVSLRAEGGGGRSREQEREEPDGEGDRQTDRQRKRYREPARKSSRIHPTGGRTCGIERGEVGRTIAP